MDFAPVEFNFGGSRWRITLDGSSGAVTSLERHGGANGRWMLDSQGLTPSTVAHVMREFAVLAEAAGSKLGFPYRS